jgi:hypothetical protein
MSNRKNYNSIVFLTTLSVYLGLVLVGGAAPSVLAQAATTRNFDIKNEIVVEDDLDKKPDDSISEDVGEVRNFRIAEALIGFVADLKKLEGTGKLSKADWNFSHQTLVEGFDTTCRTNVTTDVSNPWLKVAIEELLTKAQSEYSSSISDYVLDAENYNRRETSADVQSTANEFVLRFGFVKKSPAQARLAAEEFNKVFIERKAALENTAKLPIYENTKAHTENNQVFIVTRLPRASIDDLLAEK